MWAHVWKGGTGLPLATNPQVPPPPTHTHTTATTTTTTTTTTTNNNNNNNPPTHPKVHRTRAAYDRMLFREALKAAM